MVKFSIHLNRQGMWEMLMLKKSAGKRLFFRVFFDLQKNLHPNHDNHDNHANSHGIVFIYLLHLISDILNENNFLFYIRKSWLICSCEWIFRFWKLISKDLFCIFVFCDSTTWSKAILFPFIKKIETHLSVALQGINVINYLYQCFFLLH